VFLTACFDESIRFDFNHAICVGGYLFKPAAYAKFKRQWHRTVLRYGKRRFTAFHMVDLFAGGKEYKGMKTEHRVAILDAAVIAIGAHAYAAIGTYFDQTEFERAVSADWGEILWQHLQLSLPALPSGHRALAERVALPHARQIPVRAGPQALRRGQCASNRSHEAR
jgi:hypothetical protein